MRLALLLCAFALTACGSMEELHALDGVLAQRANEPSPDAWRPVSELKPTAGDGTPVWYRVEVPSMPVPDPALHIGGALFADTAFIGERRVELKGVHILPLENAAQPLTLRSSGWGALSPPHFTAGSEAKLWSWTLARALPPFVVGMMMVLAGLLLLTSGLRSGAERAYRGLGLFLLSLGVITVTNTPLRHLLPLRGETILYAHELATTLYPVGFVDFVLGLFGDGPRGVLRKGLRVFAAYAVVAWALHFSGLVHLVTGRAPVAIFIVVFVVQAIALAFRRARAQDASARLFLAGLAALLIVSFPDILDGAGLVEFGFDTVPYAVLLFGVSMVAVLERQHAKAREDLAAQVAALEERNREINSLNTELRHQIAERSKQIGDALQGGAPVSVSAPLETGDVIDGRYRVMDKLGRGGMGTVHLVERLTDRRQFALKIMSGSVDAVAGARFAREAEIAARVADEHLVRVVDVGGAGTGRLYIVMEFIDGRSLEDHRAKFGDVAWALPFLGQILRGVQALHAAGVVHRDLKPANVLLAKQRDGRLLAKISDFGISRLGQAEEVSRSAETIDRQLPKAPVASTLEGEKAPARRTAETIDSPGQVDEAAFGATLSSSPDLGSTLASATPAPRVPGNQLTGMHAIIGTPAYMAPELAKGARNASPASDVFALGLIAYELFTGQSPWPREPFFLALAGQPLGPIAPLPASVPENVATLVKRCLAESPADRPTAEAFLSAL